MNAPEPRCPSCWRRISQPPADHWHSHDGQREHAKADEMVSGGGMTAKDPYSH